MIFIWFNKETIMTDNDIKELKAFYFLLILYDVVTTDEQRKKIEDQVKTNVSKDRQEEWFRMSKSGLDWLRNL